MKGIYSIKINNKLYVGKDSQIEKKKRLKEHTNMLKKNNHYNYKLQEAFNKFGEIEYAVHFESEEITLEQLEVLEIYYIDLLDSYDNGYNLTLGGYGGRGMKYTKEQLQDKSKRVIGELNPASKISNEQFYKIVEMLKEGKSNKEIAEVFNIHDRYVSLIRHKKRYKKLFEGLDYEPKKSNEQKRKLNFEEFVKVVKMLDENKNVYIAKIMNVDCSTISNIRNKKMYKRYWKEYLSNQ